MKNTIEQIEDYIKSNIKGKFSSANTPATNLWFRKLSDNNYIGGDQHIILHTTNINGVIFTQKLLQI